MRPQRVAAIVRSCDGAQRATRCTRDLRRRGLRSAGCVLGAAGAAHAHDAPPPTPPLVLSGHAASLTPY